MRFVALLSLTVASAACSKSAVDTGFFKQDMVLGGVQVTAATLNHGQRFFGLHCAGCHGVKGDGKGPVAATVMPAPRDLRLGVFKFASVPAGQLPTDADFKTLLQNGLRGTGMQPWRFRDEEINALTQYVKTFSPRWLTQVPGEPVGRTDDPWRDNAAAVARGKVVYHGDGACQSCHPNYLDTHAPPPPVSATLFGPIQAPDIHVQAPRTGDSPEALYRTLAAGVGGTGMQPLAPHMPAADIWALVYYLRDEMHLSAAK